nr:GDP-fucose protein O-fucosyltransferase [Tanacetum cinerariifolium]
MQKGNTTNSTMEDTKNKLPNPLDVDTSNLKLSEFDIEVMQREIDEELKAERLKNLMAWKWDAVVDLSEDVLIVIDDESDVEVADYKESFVVKET